MATLSGQTIQSTYQGLLKLSNSSSGITQNLQAIEDGLGNNTGLKLGTDQIESPNLLSYVRLKSRYMGHGIQTTAPTQMAAGTQNIILAYPFYDSGQYAYSAVSYQLVTQTSTSDTCEFAFYTSQMINPNGLYPHTPVMSGLTAETSTPAFKTLTLGSNLSFSGYGAGIYWMVFKISNSGVQPTVRFGGNLSFNTSPIAGIAGIYGITNNLSGSPTLQLPFRTNGNFLAFSGKSTFDNPFANTLDTNQSTTASIAGSNLGFVLHTV